MTEHEWSDCRSLSTMVDYLYRLATDRRMVFPLKGTAAERKFRLYFCACCRCLWSVLEDVRSRNAVDVVERYADGLADKQELRTARAAATEVEKLEWRVSAANGYAGDAHKRWGAAHQAVLAAGKTNAVVTPRGWTSWPLEEDKQADLFRHIFGNPFRPYSVPDNWPATVIQLANALYNGEDCGFALYDALLEIGHPELAQHFRDEEAHPKGCWAVDIILGKA